VLLIVDLAIILAIAPEAILKNAHFELVSKLVPWVCGALFLSHPAWLRDQILRLSVLPWFKSLLVGTFFVVLIPQFEVIQVNPQIFPKDAILFIDGQPRPWDTPFRLRLGSHSVEIRPPMSSNREEKPRQFALSPAQVLSYSTWFRSRPHWGLIYQLPLMGDTHKYELVIRRKESGTPDAKDAEFDRDYLNNSPLYGVRLVKSDHAAVTYAAAEGEDLSGKVWLPAGAYQLTATRIGCSPSTWNKTIGPDGDSSADRLQFKDCKGSDQKAGE
jgi:hypothetical protein